VRITWYARYPQAIDAQVPPEQTSFPPRDALSGRQSLVTFQQGSSSSDGPILAGSIVFTIGLAITPRGSAKTATSARLMASMAL
jgi:hypothetical protein